MHSAFVPHAPHFRHYPASHCTCNDVGPCTISDQHYYGQGFILLESCHEEKEKQRYKHNSGQVQALSGQASAYSNRQESRSST